MERDRIALKNILDRLISIHALRMERDPASRFPSQVSGSISIHALRMERDHFKYSLKEI